MVGLRRLWFLATFSFWMGGFVFYAAVVVPIGTKVLGSAVEQGFITREVTNYLNLAGAVSLASWAMELVSMEGKRTAFRRCWVLWTMLAISLAVLVWLHPRLDSLLDHEDRFVRDSGRFYTLHRIYLWTGTLQLLASLALLHATVQNWNANK